MTGEMIAVRVLVVSRDVQTIEFLADQTERLSMQMETCCDTQSATGMNSEGNIIPCGLSHRLKASKPTILPSSNETMGW